MIRRVQVVVSCALAGATAGALALAIAAPAAPAEHPPRHHLPRSAKGNLTVGLCDGETAVEVPGVKEGETLPPAQANAVADALMAAWRRKNPRAGWDGPVLAATAGVPASARSQPLATKTTEPASSASSGGVSTTGETSSAGARQAPGAEAAHTQGGDTYGNYSERDRQIWAASMGAFIQRGKHIFHDVKDLGGTTGISCDMCHPDGANTHPETYPKFQVQLGRVALLRDMINWCLENPVRGKALPDGDERLRALEAYIYSQRKGIALDYGKH